MAAPLQIEGRLDVTLPNRGTLRVEARGDTVELHADRARDLVSTVLNMRHFRRAVARGLRFVKWTTEIHLRNRRIARYRPPRRRLEFDLRAFTKTLLAGRP